MVFIKNRVQWKKWVRDNGLDSQGSQPLAPVEYACFAYVTVHSWGFEELDENYLYKQDLEKMPKDLK